MESRIICGDALETLRSLPTASVQCVVTSPPYFGLRDYGVEGQIGLEPTLAGFIDTMVAVFDEVMRVLKNDGTLWLNLGDSYAGSWGNYAPGGIKNQQREQTEEGKRWERKAYGDTTRLPSTARPQKGLKPKDLMGVPWRVAFALQEQGWYLRSDIVWSKPNPMPESVLDRPTRAHEYMFLMTKRVRYYYDASAIRTPLAEKTYTTFGIPHQPQGNDALGGVKSDNWGRTVATRQPKTWKTPAGWDTSAGEGGHGTIHRSGRAAYQRGHSRRHAGFNDRWDSMSKDEQQMLGANKRDVWTVATKPYAEAHFATFPPELIEPCILAGSREGDTVLDPFTGSGTTCLVAHKFGRHYLGIELNPAYVEMARRRLEALPENLWSA